MPSSYSERCLCARKLERAPALRISHDSAGALINVELALVVLALPPLHKDPFDRMLAAQATVEGFVLLTSDEQVADYPGQIRKA